MNPHTPSRRNAFSAASQGHPPPFTSLRASTPSHSTNNGSLPIRPLPSNVTFTVPPAPPAAHNQSFPSLSGGQPLLQQQHAGAFRPSSHLRQVGRPSETFSPQMHQAYVSGSFAANERERLVHASRMPEASDLPSMHYLPGDEEADQQAFSGPLPLGHDYSSPPFDNGDHSSNATEGLTPSASPETSLGGRAPSLAPSLPDSLCDPDVPAFTPSERPAGYRAPEVPATPSHGAPLVPQALQVRVHRLDPTPSLPGIMPTFRDAHACTGESGPGGSQQPWRLTDLDYEGKLLPYRDGRVWSAVYCERLGRKFTSDVAHRAYHASNQVLTKQELDANTLEFGPRVYKCAWECCHLVQSGGQFGRAFELHRHMQAHHSKVRFGCPSCPKDFARRDLVLRHCETGHPRLRNLVPRIVPGSEHTAVANTSRTSRRRAGSGSSSSTGRGSSRGSGRRGGYSPESEE